MNIRTKKIFVCGLSANLIEDDFKFYFEKFGRITDVVVMHDNVTQTEDSVEDVMQKNFHELCGKLVEVKQAVPKEISTGGTTSGMRDINFKSSHQQVPYRPRYDVLPSYAPIPGYTGYPYGMFTGGYPVSGYGLGPVSPRVPWGPLPMPLYPAYLNGGHGLMGMAANGKFRTYGSNGIPSQLGGVVVDNNSLVSSSVPMDGSRNDVQNGVE
nr:RNA-binding protein 1 [Tanacetum cinerariifolium]